MARERVQLKTSHECEQIQQGGALIGGILSELSALALPGVALPDLEAHARKRIAEVGGVPAFLGYCSDPHDDPYPAALCVSLNWEVVHGPATRPLVIGPTDVVSLDIGMRWPGGDGLFTDTAHTIYHGTDESVKQLLAVTQSALDAGIAQARMGNHISDIASAVEAVVDTAGFGTIRELIGHGVGYAVHEAPEVPNYWEQGYPDTELKEGLVIAIEPMVSLGDPRVAIGSDGITFVTRKKSLVAHEEHTVIITQDGPVIATARV